eukprot:TRINITY_DN660_c0_g1_i1.p1 TRINITY_DN660_c0_g1~~TRINITY_DN660_c0_g1_i1.p1  ORF type:complete len:192 (+),score=16.02 TRINITY_DN660_c0_g1_i1:6-581(+)
MEQRNIFRLALLILAALQFSESLDERKIDGEKRAGCGTHDPSPAQNEWALRELKAWRDANPEGSTIESDYVPGKGRKIILLVEDEEAIRYALHRLLTENTIHKVITASTSQEAKRLGLEMDFDVVVLDVDIPDGDGVELFEYLRKEKSSGFWAISTGSEEDVARCLAAGFDLHLTKPVTINKLIRAVASAP